MLLGEFKSTGTGDLGDELVSGGLIDKLHARRAQNANADVLQAEHQLARNAHARQLINLSSNNQSRQEQD